MKVAFYKAKYGNLMDKLIAWWTGGPYSHVELVFSNGISFSSSQWDGGTRFKRIDYSHPERWEFVELPKWWSERDVRENAQSLQGKGYDWIAILLHEFLPLSLQDPNKWYCSEIVAALLKVHPSQISPNKLYSKLKAFNGL